MWLEDALAARVNFSGDFVQNSWAAMCRTAQNACIRANVIHDGVNTFARCEMPKFPVAYEPVGPDGAERSHR
jgi:hypothetical protein